MADSSDMQRLTQMWLAWAASFKLRDRVDMSEEDYSVNFPSDLQ